VSSALEGVQHSPGKDAEIESPKEGEHDCGCCRTRDCRGLESARWLGEEHRDNYSQIVVPGNCAVYHRDNHEHVKTGITGDRSRSPGRLEHQKLRNKPSGEWNTCQAQQEQRKSRRQSERLKPNAGVVADFDTLIAATGYQLDHSERTDV